MPIPSIGSVPTVADLRHGLRGGALSGGVRAPLSGGTVGTGFDYWYDGAPVMVLADGGGFDYWDPGAPVMTG